MTKAYIQLAWLLSYLFMVGHAMAWPSFHYAPGTEINWTADRMVVNGLVMKVENYSCECPERDILAYYRGRWTKERKQLIENDLGEYRQIGYGDRRYFYAVTVKPDINNHDYSVGRITISEMPKENSKAVVLGEGIPQMGNAQVINDVFDAMPGKRSRVVLLISDFSVADNARYYRNYYAAEGWKSYLRPLNEKIGMQAISYSQDNKDVNIVIHESDGRSHILFNEVTEVR